MTEERVVAMEEREEGKGSSKGEVGFVKIQYLYVKGHLTSTNAGFLSGVLVVRFYANWIRECVSDFASGSGGDGLMVMVVLWRPNVGQQAQKVAFGGMHCCMCGIFWGAFYNFYGFSGTFMNENC